MKIAAWSAGGLLAVAVLLRLCFASAPTPVRPPSPTAPPSERAVEKEGATVDADDPLQPPALQERLRIVHQTRDQRLQEARERLDRAADAQKAQAEENVRRQRERLNAAGIDPDAPSENIVGPK